MPFLIAASWLNQLVATALHRQIEIGQHPFKQNAITTVILVAKRCSDALKDKLAGSVKGNRKAISLHQGACDTNRVGIACSRIMRRQKGASDFPILIIEAAIGVNGSHFGIVNDGNAGDNHDFRPALGQFFQVSLQLLVRAFGLVGFVKQIEKLREKAYRYRLTRGRQRPVCLSV